MGKRLAPVAWTAQTSRRRAVEAVGAADRQRIEVGRGPDDRRDASPHEQKPETPQEIPPRPGSPPAPRPRPSDLALRPRAQDRPCSAVFGNSAKRLDVHRRRCSPAPRRRHDGHAGSGLQSQAAQQIASGGRRVGAAQCRLETVAVDGGKGQQDRDKRLASSVQPCAVPIIATGPPSTRTARAPTARGRRCPACRAARTSGTPQRRFWPA